MRKRIPIDEERLRHLFSQDLSTTIMGQRFGCCGRTVRRRLCELSLWEEKKMTNEELKKERKETAEKIVNLVNNHGMKREDVAKRLGVSKSTIYRRLNGQ